MTACLHVSVTLRLTAPGGVAAPELLRQDDDGLLLGTALPLARTPDGTPWIPATSLAGSLRTHLADRAEAFLGGEPGEEVLPSTLWLLGTRVDHEGVIERTRTAIDRWRGAAAAGPLRRSEHLPAGTRITVYLRLDDVALADELLGALRAWRPRIGGGRTIGHGACVLEQVRSGLLDLDTPEGRRIWLTRGGPDLFGDDLTDHVETPPVPETTPPVLSLSWSVVDGLHIGNGEIEYRTGQNDVALLLRTHDGRPEIPGSTWKGLLRSRCEFILRSLGVPCCSPAVDLDATTSGCGDCLICRAFGTASSAGPSRRGRLDFRSSPVADAEIVEQRHVALDRVFGGARPSALYCRQVVRSGTLDLVVDALDTLPPGATALVTLACLDIHDGLLGVGAATTRGLGTLRLRSTPEAVEALRTEALHSLTAAVTNEDTATLGSRTT